MFKQNIRNNFICSNLSVYTTQLCELRLGIFQAAKKSKGNQLFTSIPEDDFKTFQH